MKDSLIIAVSLLILPLVDSIVQTRLLIFCINYAININKK